MQNLEKSYEVQKSKLKESEEQRSRLAEENSKLQDELVKMKNARNRLNKEVNDLKSSQASTIDHSAKKALQVDDLEKSQNVHAAAAPSKSNQRAAGDDPSLVQ